MNYGGNYFVNEWHALDGNAHNGIGYVHIAMQYCWAEKMWKDAWFGNLH